MVKHYTISEKNYSWVMDIEYSESNDCFWIGSAEKIYCFDGHTIKSYKNTLGQDFNCKEIELSDKGLWIGRGSGIYFWRNGHVEEVHFKHKDINKARTYSLLNDENNLWIGNINGLYKFTLDSISYLGVQNELLRNRINDIEKLNSILLLATNGAGILFYDKLNGEVFQLETNNSDLPSNSIQDIYIESDSIIWGATNSGAFRLKIKNLKEKKFKFNILSSYNGLPSKEVNDIELFLDKVFFATNNGLAFIDKDEIRKNRTPPKIHIRKLLINNRIVDFNFFNQFDADKNTIAIEYIGLSYRKAGDLNYKFRMNGLDTTWVHTKQRIQRFTTLEPGKYSFEVFAQNEDGVWSSEPAVYSFQINKPFYQQWWFLVLAFMLFFASFWIIYKRRINALRKKNLLLQSINSYKQRILSQQMNPHFIFNTLNSIQYYLLDEDINASLHYLSQFAKLMRQILDNSQRDKITIEEELDALRLYLELESLRFEENFEYKITVDKKINTFEWKILPLLLQPYVENAIKHGLLHKKGKGLISIKLNMADKKIQCIIEDNGVGRAFTLNKNQNRGEGHVSWGAKISSERIALLNSLYGDDIKVIYTDLKDENNQPLGTRVEIFIPVLV